MDWDRWARAGGMAAAALFAIGFAILGENPGENDPDKITSLYADHAGRVLTGETIILASLVVAAWFFGALASALRDSGESRLAGTTLVLGAVVLGAQAILQALDTTLAQAVADRGDQGVTLALHSLTWNIDVAASMFFAGYILLASAGLVRGRTLPRWYGRLSLVLFVLVLLRATNWAADGFWAPNGGYLYIGITSIIVWLALTSFLLFRAASEARPQAGVRP